MKKIISLLFCLFLVTNSFSQINKNKKIKEVYIESFEGIVSKDNNFLEFDSNGETISEGSWEFADNTKTKFKKKNEYKILTKKEENYTYIYDKNKNIITKTQYFEEGKYTDNFVGQIKKLEILSYRNNNKLFKKTIYEATIDTSDAGREELNNEPDLIAYNLRTKKLGVEYISYELNKTSIEQYNEKGELDWIIGVDNDLGMEYSYDEFGNVNSYTKYYCYRIDQNFSLREIANADWESLIFRDKNIEAEYEVKYKFDEFGNWIEKTTNDVKYPDSEYFKKEIRHIVYF